MHNKQRIGKIGEIIVSKYLQKNGYQIIERNFRCKQGEIDIIAWDIEKNEMVFIEVKTRTNFKYGEPAEAVNKEKRRRIWSSIEYYVYVNKITSSIRIDVVEVYISKLDCFIHHIKQAF